MSFWDFTHGPARSRSLVDYGRQQGLSATDLLAGTGISPAQLDDPNAELFAEQELRLIRNLLKLTGAPPQLGIKLGLAARFSVYGVWGLGLISSATMRDAMRLALRFLPLTFAFTTISYHEEGDLGVITFVEPDLDRDLTRFIVEGDMAGAAMLLAEVAGPDFVIERMTFKAKPTHADKARRIFGALPRYGAPSNSLAFPLAYLDRKLPQANPITAAQCEQMCADLIARRRARPDLTTIVRQYLIAPGGPVPDLASMARIVNVSERTLKRRLKDEGTSFRTLLAESRRTIAEDLLKDRTLSLADIAAQLGFSDASTFSQAFKRWQGVAPNVYRQRTAARVRID